MRLVLIFFWRGRTTSHLCLMTTNDCGPSMGVVHFHRYQAVTYMTHYRTLNLMSSSINNNRHENVGGVSKTCRLRWTLFGFSPHSLSLSFTMFHFDLTVFSLFSYYLYDVYYRFLAIHFTDTIDKIDLKRWFTGPILNSNIVLVACIQLEIVCLFHVETDKLNRPTPIRDVVTFMN